MRRLREAFGRRSRVISTVNPARQRGAAAVEMAICLPLLATIFTGIADYGMAFNASRQIGTAASAGARQGAAAGIDRLADYAVLRTLQGALANQGDVQKIVVYKSSGTGKAPTACLTNSISGVCNTYSGSVLTTLNVSNFNHTNCVGDLDASWCPTTRNTAFTANQYLGVAVVVHRNSVFASLGADQITRNVSFRLEVRAQ